MYLNSEIESLIATLKADDRLCDICFLKAYPYATKPTRMTKKCAVLSPNSLNLESVSVDNEDFYGLAEIRIDLFSPYNFGSPVAFDDMQRIVKRVMNSETSKISISPISNNDALQCYVLTAVLGFGYYQKTEEA